MQSPFGYAFGVIMRLKSTHKVREVFIGVTKGIRTRIFFEWILRQSVFKILRCRLQFGPQPEVDNEVIELCHNVIRESVADIDHQWRVDSSDLKFGHIWTAAQILDDPSTTADVLARLNDYAAQHADIAQTKEFRNLLTILEGRWEPELQVTDDFEAV